MDAFLYELHQNKLFRAIDVPATLREQKQKYSGWGTLYKDDHCIALHLTDSLPTKESDVPLKKILLWNGASSWGSLKPGRGVFLKVGFALESSKLR